MISLKEIYGIPAAFSFVLPLVSKLLVCSMTLNMWSINVIESKSLHLAKVWTVEYLLSILEQDKSVDNVRIYITSTMSCIYRFAP